MIQSDIYIKDDEKIAAMEARRGLLEWLSQALSFAEDFPLEKHTPEAFFELYQQSGLTVHPELSVDDIKRGFALYLLDPSQETLVIPDEWVLYDDVAFLLKELWYSEV